MIDFKKALEYKSKLKKSLANQNFQEIEKLIKEYESLNPKDIELYTIKANLHFMKGDYLSAESELLKAYEKFEFNFDINYNLAVVYLYKKEPRKTCYYFLKCILCNPDSSESILKELENLLTNGLISMKDFNNARGDIAPIENNLNKQFPLKDSDSTYVGNFLCKDNYKQYMSGYYDYYFPERDGKFVEFPLYEKHSFKSEMLPSKELKNISFTVDKKTLMPIMILNTDSIINLNINNEEFKLKNLLPKRFYYYPVEKDTSINLDCSDNFILGDLIPLEYDKNKPRLVLNIFIDGLSQKFLEKNNLEEVMPNTYKFFKEGTICENCYVGGDWTYVSLASFFTGLYTNEHMVFHPDYGTDRLWGKELFTEILNNEGYFTAKIDGDWRSTPTSGYIKGIDRYLYQPSLIGMHCDEVVLETIEHLETFKDKNNFVWICLPDLHDIADEFEGRISTQVHNNIESRIFDKTTETSVRKGYDIKKIHRYKNQLKRIDTYLGLLLNYIKDNYSDDEFLVSLVSDHGQGFLIESQDFLDEERVKVPMMFRGLNVPKGTCSELTQSMDLFTIIFNSIGIKDFDKKQTNLPAYFKGDNSRKYTFSESIFPKSPYRATVTDLNHKFLFETKENCNADGRFKANDYTFKLINKITNKDETSQYKEKVEEFLEIIFEKIQEFIIIE
ncbi:sulfatase-like hydrolase/transferase [Clostridium tetani]|uniref:sulfatase-like hydrolase/transferase n=1 Tax=Clostridium tetani TaxID=1513 RepID=UPI00100AEFD7|nr:sulfatase-like hydrolase/transferase [Clostridium tetani]RXM57067.1 sulfatase [Clostridium tetani]